MSVAHYFDTMDYGTAPESDSQAHAWLQSHAARFGHFINGCFVEASQHFASVEPATGNHLADIGQATIQDVDAAVAAARTAQPGWFGLGGHGRARHLYALARTVQRHARLLAVLESLDNGKSVRETRDIDIPLVIRHFYHHAGWAQLQEKEFAGYEPLGVAGQIIPWNFPLLMLAWKIAPALALGNTVVLKPAEATSLTALLFAELAAKSGLPAGVLNIVTGDGQVGAALAGHPGIDKVAFTGSTGVGRQIRTITAGSGKALTLELGGKSPFIIFDDADIDGAIEGIVDAIWFNQGQVCCAGSRLLVQEGIAQDVITRLKRRMDRLRVGHPLDKTVDMAAMIAAGQVERVQSLVKTGIEEGAVCYQPALDLPAGGCFYPPTLLTNVHPSSTVANEEIFGPVLVAMTFRTPDEAVALANNSRYGLAASVWSETIGLALDIAPKLQAGVVWVNAANLFDAGVSFGGCRESGFGREGGREGLFEYMRPQAWSRRQPRLVKPPVACQPIAASSFDMPELDRTAKLFIGGKQVRPDGNYSLPVLSNQGLLVGEVGAGSSKDIRNAVSAARAAEGWSKASAHNRAQILYYIAENLSARASGFAARLMAMTGTDAADADREVEASIKRLFTYAAWADKFEGQVHTPPIRGLALATREPVGVVGVVCPAENPLLGFVSLLAPLIATGNRVVLVPGEAHPLIATDFYQVLETSDVPDGVINIVTGPGDGLVKALAGHDDLDALWVFGSAQQSALAEQLSIGNLKRTLVDNGLATDWYDDEAGEGLIFLRHATRIKTIWIPFGE